jgi:hypothetical protein
MALTACEALALLMEQYITARMAAVVVLDAPLALEVLTKLTVHGVLALVVPVAPILLLETPVCVARHALTV